MADEVIRANNLKRDNIILSIAAARSVTDAQLQQPQETRRAVLTDASKITHEDVEIGALLAFPITPMNNEGRLTASPDTINGVDGETSELVILRAINPNVKPRATEDDLVCEIITYTGPACIYSAPLGPHLLSHHPSRSSSWTIILQMGSSWHSMHTKPCPQWPKFHKVTIHNHLTYLVGQLTVRITTTFRESNNYTSPMNSARCSTKGPMLTRRCPQRTSPSKQHSCVWIGM